MEALTLTHQDFIEHNGMLYMDAELLGKHLGYDDPIRNVSRLYKRHEDELEPFSMVVKMTTKTKKQRIFDEHGCYMMGMLAKTEQAKAFRKGLAQFLREFRIRTDEFNRINAETSKIKQELAKLKLMRAFSSTTVIDKAKMKRLVELKPILTNNELSKVFGMSESRICHYLKLHREANGDFEDKRPAGFVVKGDLS